MKALISFILFFASFQILAQEEPQSIVPLDEETGLIQFREVVNEEGSQNDLFNRCIYWLNDYYTNPTRVTTIRDYNSGRIEGTHNIRLYYYSDDSIKTQAGIIDYLFKIDIKDNKYRYTISELKLRSKTRMPVEEWLNKDATDYNPRWDEYLNQMADFFEGWSANLKEKMKPEVKKSEDDW